MQSAHGRLFPPCCGPDTAWRNPYHISGENGSLSTTIALRGGMGRVSNDPSAETDSSMHQKPKGDPIAMEAALQI
jgi:hypothetical protein